MTVFDGARTYKAHDIVAEHGDRIGMEFRPDGRWLAVGEGESQKRYPLLEEGSSQLGRIGSMSGWTLTDEGRAGS